MAIFWFVLGIILGQITAVTVIALLSAAKRADERQPAWKSHLVPEEGGPSFSYAIAYCKCVLAAEKEYWDYVKLSGGEEDPYRPGVYQAPAHVWETALKQKGTVLDLSFREYERQLA